MPENALHLRRFFRVGSAVHAVALADAGEVWAGSERDLRLLDVHGRIRFRLGGAHAVRPFNAVACGAEGRAFALERTGRLHRLDPLHGDADGDVTWTPEALWTADNDLYGLAAAAAGQERGLVALGHLGAGLTVLDRDGELRWRCGAGDGESPCGRTWSVAFSADAATLYAGCLAAARRANDAACRLVALDAASGQVVAEHAPVEPVSQVVALVSASGVAAVHATQRGCRIVGYDSGLRVVMWSVTCAPGEMVTALAVDAASGWLIAGTSAGRVWLLHGQTGDRLAEYDLLYYSTVLSVAGMNLPAADGVLVAGLANGQLAYLDRRKASGRYEDERERTESQAG